MIFKSVLSPEVHEYLEQITKLTVPEIHQWALNQHLEHNVTYAIDGTIEAMEIFLPDGSYLGIEREKELGMLQ